MVFTFLLKGERERGSLPSAGAVTGSSAFAGLGPKGGSWGAAHQACSHYLTQAASSVWPGVRANHGRKYNRAQTEKDTVSIGSFVQAFLRKVEIVLAILVFVETEKSTFDNIFKK